MLTYFNEGGALFMGMLSIVFLVVFILSIKNALVIFSKEGDKEKISSQISSIKSLGLFALVLGFLGQFLGLFQAFSFIAEVGTISPAILASGLKVSSITSIYGMIIFLVAYLIWFGLNLVLKKE
ncbi:MAG: MotA/TolQ/ExbB proton channel family protein [Cyclobacteriaceae bacterium]|nr:MotA/TolQ/ExbB proton channel family protein [Cyclobacteriaceae bacterium]